MTIFTDQAAAVAEFNIRSAMVLRRYYPGAPPGDDVAWKKMLAAESLLARRLRVRLEPTQVFPTPVAQADIDALNGAPYEEEPGYDFSSVFFQGDSWGFIPLRLRPVIAIQSIQFVYPFPTVVWDVPAEWIRLDKRYGQVRIVPTAGTTAYPLAMWSAQVMSGSRSIPHMIKVKYTAGLTDALEAYPDVEDLIYQMAGLSLVQDAMAPASVSQSVDGFSQSMSTDMSKMGEALDAKIASLRDWFQGIRLGVL